MTIGNQTVKTDVVANGVNYTFDYDFLVPETGATELYLTDPDGVEIEIASNAYTVADEGDPDGGTFTYPLSGDPVTSGWVLTLIRTNPYTQPTNLSNQGAFYPQAIQGGLDWLAMQTQQLAEAAGRAPKVPVSEGPIGDLPALEDRKGMILGFNSDTGEPEATTPGEPGPPGTNGALWFNSVGTPSDTIGSDNDYDLEDDGTVWEKAGGIWVDTGVNLQGPPGTTTITGGVTGDTSSTIGNIATWSNTAGTAIDDSGVAVSNVVLKTGTQTIAGAKTFSDALTIDDNVIVTGAASISGRADIFGDAYFSGSVAAAYSDDDGATAGPEIELYRESATPADNDLLGIITFSGEDDGGNYVEYAVAGAQALDVSDGSEDAAFYIKTQVAGTLTTQALASTGLVIGPATGGAQGTGTVNATGFYVNGSAIGSGWQGQIQTATYGTNNTISASMPISSSAPTNSQGTEIITLAVTPNNASSRLWIQAVVHFRADCTVTANSTGSVSGVVALFVDSTTNALQSSVGCSIGGQAQTEATWAYYGENTVVLEYEVSAASTSARTYKIRVGKTTAGTLTSSTLEINDGSMGSTKVSRLTVMEIPPAS